MKKVWRLPWSVKYTILAVLSIIFVSPAAYSQNPSASELIKDGTLNVPYTLSDGTCCLRQKLPGCAVIWTTQ